MSFPQRKKALCFFRPIWGHSDLRMLRRRIWQKVTKSIDLFHLSIRTRLKGLLRKILCAL